jgi:hypothetical protein
MRRDGMVEQKATAPVNRHPGEGRDLALAAGGKVEIPAFAGKTGGKGRCVGGT